MKKDGLQSHQDRGGQAMGHLDPALGIWPLGARCLFILNYRVCNR
jgi:hypothetical protein